MQIHTAINVSAPAEKAWEVIGEKFGDFGEWTTALESSSLRGELGVGATRVCRTNGVGLFPPMVAEERLITFDPEQKSYTYVVTKGLPAMFKRAQNAWSIETIDKTNCIVHSHVNIEMKTWIRPFSWIFGMAIKRDMKKFFSEMSYFIETGKIHPRKMKSIPEPT